MTSHLIILLVSVLCSVLSCVAFTNLYLRSVNGSYIYIYKIIYYILNNFESYIISLINLTLCIRFVRS